MNSFRLPPAMDCAPQFCFCGRRTVESHEFWFCSTECARQDSLRSLDNPKCHYRQVVQANVRADATEPRRIMSADHSGAGTFVNPPIPLPPPKNMPHQGNAPFARRAARDRNVAGFPTLSQVTGKVLTKNATAGEPPTTERPRWDVFPNATSRTRPMQGPSNLTFEQISLDAIPLPEHVPAHTLRRVPSSINSLRDNARKNSAAALLNLGRSRKAKEGKDPEKIFGHYVTPIVPPVRKESLPSYQKMNPTSVVPVQTTKALRRSASFSGFNATAHNAGGPVNERDTVMRVIEEMREELSESFDPRSLFDQEEDY